MVVYKRVLVVEPEPGIRFVFREALQTLGETIEVVTTESGREALNEVRNEPFDLVITALVMPEMSGIELTESIKALNPETAIVWITTYGCHNFAPDLQRLGVLSCHEKPMEIREILALAKKALNIDRKAA